MILCLELQYTAIITIGGVVSLRKNKVQKNEECLSNSDDLRDLFQQSATSLNRSVLKLRHSADGLLWLEGQCSHPDLTGGPQGSGHPFLREHPTVHPTMYPTGILANKHWPFLSKKHGMYRYVIYWLY